MFKGFIIVILVFITGLSSDVVAEHNSFEIMVYDSSDGTVTTISNQGIQNSFLLPMPEGYSLYAPRAFAADAQPYIAYRVSNEDRTRSQFIVYHYGAEAEIILSYPIDFPVYDNLEHMSAHLQVFSEANQVIYSYTSQEKGWTVGAWTMLVFDLASGEIAYQYNAEDYLSRWEDTVNIPLPYAFEDGQVTFNLFSVMIDLGTHHGIYTWSLQTGKVTELPYRLSLSHDRFASMIIDKGRDNTLPQNPDFSNVVRDHHNTLWFILNGEQYILYQDNNLNFDQTYFVQGGDRILAHTNSPDDLAGQWMIFDGYGTPLITIPAVSEEGQYFVPRFISGVRDGFVYMFGNDVYLMLINMDTAIPTYLATVPGNIIAVKQNEDTYSVIFEQWSAVGIRFEIGDVVAITEAGNQVRMRTIPGGEVMRQFNAGSLVTIVGGPQSVDGVRWWQVQDENGLIGWLAEGLENGVFLDRIP